MKEKEKINPNQSKYDYMLENNKDYMNYTALSFDNRKISYEEMHYCIEKYAKMLYGRGIRKGDLVAVCAFNSPESVYLLYALDKIGAIVIGVNPFDNKEKIKKDLEITRPKMVITVDLNYSSFKDFEKALNFSTILYSPVESMSDRKLKFGYNLMQIKNGNFKLSREAYLKNLLKGNYDGIVIPENKFIEGATTDIMFTGGSTGTHKGVELAGEGLNYVVEGMNSLFHPYPGMVHLGEIPFGPMSYGKMLLHYSLCNNMEYALTLKAMPNDFYDELVRTGAEAAAGGPPHWTSLIEKQGDGFVPSSKIKEGSLSNLKFATSGGEAMKSNTYDAIINAFRFGGSNAILGDGLGSTETWGTMIVNNGDINSVGTLGYKISTIDVKLVDPITGLEVKDGEKGLLNVSGKTVMNGYYNNPEETNKVMSYDENGKKWMNLGDYLIKLPSGKYEYVGRQKRNFVSDVENIYPEQLEEFLNAIPEIREVVVTPISDEIRQFIPKYHISLYDSTINKDELEKKINQLVMNKFGASWLPGFIEYYYEPLVRMQNTKIDFGYYLEKDKKEMESSKDNLVRRLEL